MRIRNYPAIGFGILVLASAYLGLAPSIISSYKQSDKVLHFITFFLLTLCFYWILETTRRKNIQLTLLVCPGVLGVGSEIVQALLPNGRDFDIFDIFFNVIGSLAALAICTWYHKRMLERKRKTRTFGPLTEGEEDDLELGEGPGSQENGVIPEPTLEQEVDNWDENAEDWDEDDENVNEAEANGEEEVPKKRND